MCPDAVECARRRVRRTNMQSCETELFLLCRYGRERRSAPSTLRSTLGTHDRAESAVTSKRCDPACPSLPNVTPLRLNARRARDFYLRRTRQYDPWTRRHARRSREDARTRPAAARMQRSSAFYTAPPKAPGSPCAAYYSIPQRHTHQHYLCHAVTGCTRHMRGQSEFARTTRRPPLSATTETHRGSPAVAARAITARFMARARKRLT